MKTKRLTFFGHPFTRIIWIYNQKIFGSTFLLFIEGTKLKKILNGREGIIWFVASIFNNSFIKVSLIIFINGGFWTLIQKIMPLHQS